MKLSAYVCGHHSTPRTADSESCRGWLKSSVPTAQVGFNVELGGYFSGKRNTMSIDGDTFLARDQVVAYCEALLKVFRCVLPVPAAAPLAWSQASLLP